MTGSHCNSEGVINGLTFDVEDWYHGFGLSPTTWKDFEPRLSVGLRRILDLLDAHRVQATFFVLGALSVEWRSLLGTIADAGHEIASHGYWHTPVYNLTPASFARDVRQVLGALQSITDQPIQSYRAPFFSITRNSLWALPILAEAGFVGDSSIVPAHNPRYGIPDAHRFPHCIFPAGSGLGHLTEYPISTLTCGRANLPFGGGFYARFLPYRLIRRAVRQLNALGQPAVFYFHPWEMDPDHPRITEGIPALYRFTHYYGLSRSYSRLKSLLRDFSFQPLAHLPRAKQIVIYTDYRSVAEV